MLYQQNICKCKTHNNSITFVVTEIVLLQMLVGLDTSVESASVA